MNDADAVARARKTMRSIAVAAAVLAAALVAYFVVVRPRLLRRRAEREYGSMLRRCESVDPTDTIFVSVPSFRDPQAAQTIADLFAKAHCPLRVFVGCCQQNADRDEAIASALRRMGSESGESTFARRVRYHFLNAADAKGPMHARSLIERHLYGGERYYLMVDSHTMFARGWDRLLIENLREIQAARKAGVDHLVRHFTGEPTDANYEHIQRLDRLRDRCVITAYPAGFSPGDRRLQGAVLGRGSPMVDAASKPGRSRFLSFKSEYSKEGIPLFQGVDFAAEPEQSVPTLTWAGCFAFSEASVIRDVPFDGEARFVFFGEEFSQAARLFTHGYDLFAPKVSVVRHMWDRRGRDGTFWDLLAGDGDVARWRRAEEAEGYRRVRFVAGLEVTPPSVELLPGARYGLGTERGLEEYFEFCGVDPRLRTATKRARLGVSATASDREIESKYGSLREYRRREDALSP